MAIEFRCGQCDKLLRTGDETAGKRAKCPTCGTIVNVPAATAETPSAGPPPPLRPGAAAAGPPPGVAPAAGPGDLRPTPIDIGDVINTTWEVFQRQWAMCIAVPLIVGVIGGVGWLAFRMMLFVALLIHPLLAIPIGLCGVVVLIGLNVWLQIGMLRMFVKMARGHNVEFSELFSGGDVILPCVGAQILASLVVMAGLLLCVVPGIIFALMLSQVSWLIIDRNLGVFDAMGVSIEVTRGSKLTLFLTALVTSIAGMLVIMLTCGLGCLVVSPFLILLSTIIYLRMTGQPIATATMPGYPNA